MSNTQNMNPTKLNRPESTKAKKPECIDNSSMEGRTLVAASNRAATRRRLPDERHSLTHHFSIGGQEGCVTIGLYEDGMPGEMFIRMAKEGSTVSGLMDSFATVISLDRGRLG